MVMRERDCISLTSTLPSRAAQRILRRIRQANRLPSDTEGKSMRRVFRIPFSRFRLVREVDEEILFHLQTRIDALVASGMSPADARATALKQFGDVHGVR